MEEVMRLGLPLLHYTAAEGTLCYVSAARGSGAPPLRRRAVWAPHFSSPANFWGFLVLTVWLTANGRFIMEDVKKKRERGFPMRSVYEKNPFFFLGINCKYLLEMEG